MNNYKIYHIDVSDIANLPSYAFKNWTAAAEDFKLSDYIESVSVSTENSEADTLKELLTESVKTSDVVKFNSDYFYCNGASYIRLK